MARTEFSIDMGKLDEKLRTAVPNVRQEVKKELFQFANEVMTVSKQERVPVNTGALMSTGDVKLPVDEGAQVTVTMGYGGMAANGTEVGYAWHVHEMVEGTGRKKGVGMAIHWTRPGSGPFYLINPLHEVQGKLPGRIKDAVARGFKK